MHKLFLILLVLLLLLPACDNERPSPPTPVTVKTMSVVLAAQNSRAIYSGAVKGRYESRLGFQVGGRIIARHVDLGDKVASGAELMAIDPKDLEEGVRIAAAQVDSSKSRLNLAETDFRRYERLYKDAAVSQAQFDQYKTAFEAATETLRQAEAQHNQAVNALGYSRLAADADGVISAVEAEVGQVVAAGQSVVTLVRSQELEVEIHIPENRMSSLSLGQEAEVSFWALPGQESPGHIREISPMADMATRTYTARVSLPNPPAEVQLGMTASVTAAGDLNDSQKVALIPVSAIYQTDDQARVWLVKDGRVILQAVTAMSFDENQVIITDGLDDGDVLVTAGVHKLREGQEVRLMDQAE